MIGEIVLFCVAEGVVRPALVVNEFGSDLLNLRVFLDGSNDSALGRLPHEVRRLSTDIAWCTSVPRGEAVGEWREKAAAAAATAPPPTAAKKVKPAPEPALEPAKPEPKSAPPGAGGEG